MKFYRKQTICKKKSLQLILCDFALRTFKGKDCNPVFNNYFSTVSEGVTFSHLFLQSHFLDPSDWFTRSFPLSRFLHFTTHIGIFFSWPAGKLRFGFVFGNLAHYKSITFS